MSVKADAMTHERLADYAHEAWTRWMRYMFSRTTPSAGGMLIPSAWVERWQRQMDTPYARLPAREQASDREEAYRILAIVALSPRPEAPAWQEMDSAPKDGRTVLVLFPQIGVWAVSWSTAVFDDGFWSVSDNKSEDRPLRGWTDEPTHWMALPDPPSPPTEAAR